MCWEMITISWAGKKKLDCVYKIIYTAGPCEGYFSLSYVMIVWGLKKKWKKIRNLSWLLRQEYLTARAICLLLICAWVMLWETLSCFFWLFKAGKVAAAMSAGDRLVILDTYAWEEGRGKEKKNW